jgi:hypothetical protein
MKIIMMMNHQRHRPYTVQIMLQTFKLPLKCQGNKRFQTGQLFSSSSRLGYIVKFETENFGAFNRYTQQKSKEIK